MNSCSLASTLILGCGLAGSSYAQSYTYSAIKTGLPATTIQRPYSINDSGTILLQTFTSFNQTSNCLLIQGTTVMQTELYPSDQFFAISNNGYITGRGVLGTYYINDVNYNVTNLSVPSTDTVYPTGINSALTVVGMATSPTAGFYGWTAKNGIFTKFVYPGSSECTLSGINDSGNVIGTYFTDKSHAKYMAFALIKDKNIHISVPNCIDPMPSAIGGSNIVVGTAITNSTNRMIGFVYGKNGNVETIDYKPHAPASVESPNDGAAKLSSTYGTEVFGVNSGGVIVGLFSGTYVSTNGQWAESVYIPFMATPK